MPTQALLTHQPKRPLSSLLTNNISLQCANQEPGLILPFQERRRWVPLAQIIRFEGDINYTRCHFLDGSSLLVARSLKALTSRLPERSFIRVHRKHLLNVQHISGISRAFSLILMNNGDRFPLARRRVAQFRAMWCQLTNIASN